MRTKIDNFESWRDIKKFAEDLGLKYLPAKLEMNSKFWMSSGEFGRSQKLICNSILFAESDEEATEIAKEIDDSLKDDEGLRAYMAIGDEL